MATCSSCHRPILWCLTETGSRMPIDPDPVPDGIVVKTGATEPDPHGGPRAIDVVRVLKKAERSLFDIDEDDDAGLRFNSHMATCPNRDRHRKPR